MESEENRNPNGGRRYRLMCLDKNVQLDEVCLRRRAVGDAMSFQFARFALHPKIYVDLRHEIKLTTVSLESVNISRTGMLLRTQAPQDCLPSIPVESATLARLDTAHLWLPHTLEVQAKSIRSYVKKNGSQNYGFVAIQFQPFSTADAILWGQLLSRLERSEIAGSECVRPAYDPRKI
jgi:hypothetical protein